MQQTVIEQLADHEAKPAGGVELIDVGLPVGINARHQRHDTGQVREVRPVQPDPGCGGDGHQMHRVVGRASRGEQAHHSVDHRGLVHQAADGQITLPQTGELQHLSHRRDGEPIAQLAARVDERSPGKLQAHELHEHLVAVGRAVEGAGAGAVIGGGLGGDELGPARLPGGIGFSDASLFSVGQARGHGARGHEYRGQVAERQRPHEETGNDLVADPETDDGIEHVVRERHRRGHGDDVAAEERQLHSRPALSDAVAHGGHAAGHLGDGACLLSRPSDQVRIALVGLVGAEHVVVGRHDADVRGGFSG